MRDLDLVNPPPISGLPAPTQAYIVVFWQLMRAGRSVAQISLPLYKLWAGLAAKPYVITLVYVDAKTGHGVHMATRDGRHVTFDMVTDLVRLLRAEVQTPRRPCRNGQRFCEYCISFGSTNYCHYWCSTIFRFLNSPDHGTSQLCATFDRNYKVVLPPASSGFEVRFKYDLSDASPTKPSQTKPNQAKPSRAKPNQAKATVCPRECGVFSPSDFTFCSYDPAEKLHMNPHCTIGQLMPSAMVRHVLRGPEPTVSAAAGVNKRSSRTPRQWPGILWLLGGTATQGELNSWFETDCARDVSKGRRQPRAGDDLRWDYQIKPGRVEEVLGPGSEPVLLAARALLDSHLSVRDTVWLRNTTHHILVSYPGVAAQVCHSDGCQATIIIPLQQPAHSGGTMFTSRHEPQRTFCFNDHLVIGGALFFDGVVEHYGGENASQDARIFYYIEVGDRNN